MKKNFQIWHRKKENINDQGERRFYHEREVWWCSLGVNVGFEMDGKGEDFVRPVLILKGFSKEIFICVPLTTKTKQGKFYSDVRLGDEKPRKIILSQIRLVDSKRLQEKIATLDEAQFNDIKKKIIRLLE